MCFSSSLIGFGSAICSAVLIRHACWFPLPGLQRLMHLDVACLFAILTTCHPSTLSPMYSTLLQSQYYTCTVYFPTPLAMLLDGSSGAACCCSFLAVASSCNQCKDVVGLFYTYLLGCIRYVSSANFKV